MMMVVMTMVMAVTAMIVVVQLTVLIALLIVRPTGINPGIRISNGTRTA